MFFRSLLTLFCGLVSSGLTALILAGILIYWDYNFLSMSVLFILPIGAMIAGLISGSGYLIGGYWAQARVNRILLLGVVLGSAATLLGIYYLLYRVSAADAIRDTLGFWDYLRLYLTTAHYTHGGDDWGAVGGWGYVLLGLHYLGFFLGNVSMAFFLLLFPACPSCKKFLKYRGTIRKKFSDQKTYETYYEDMLHHAADATKLISLLQKPPSAAKPVDPSDIELDLTLSQCRGCGAQFVKTGTRVREGTTWRILLHHAQEIQVQAEPNLIPIFRPLRQAT